MGLGILNQPLLRIPRAVRALPREPLDTAAPTDILNAEPDKLAGRPYRNMKVTAGAAAARLGPAMRLSFVGHADLQRDSVPIPVNQMGLIWSTWCGPFGRIFELDWRFAMKAKDVMTSTVISVQPNATILQAARQMLQHHISGLPVIDQGGEIVGILSEGDFLRRRETGTERRYSRWLEFLMGPGRLAVEYSHSHGSKVAEVMTTEVHTITEDTPLKTSSK
jgi:CBS domain-containing protein